MLDFIGERDTGTSRAVKILQRQLCLGQSEVYVFVREISINEESVILCNYEKRSTTAVPVPPYIPWNGFFSTDRVYEVL